MVWYINTTDCYSAIKRNEIGICVILSGEQSQEKSVYIQCRPNLKQFFYLKLVESAHVEPLDMGQLSQFLIHSHKDKIIEMENTLVVAKG
jgi:hypothetical protein